MIEYASNDQLLIQHISHLDVIFNICMSIRWPAGGVMSLAMQFSRSRLNRLIPKINRQFSIEVHQTPDRLNSKYCCEN